MLFLSAVLFPAGVQAKYYSQPCSGQDKYLNEQIFKGKRNGVFIDVGAHDGVTYSNTYFFEQELAWSGLCVEPVPTLFQKLEKNRGCICVQGCISDKNCKSQFLAVTSAIDTEYTEMLSGLVDMYDERHLQRIDKELALFGGTKEILEIECYRLDDLLKFYNIAHVDYLSIDVEGAEMLVLKSIDFSNVDIDVITIENNYDTKDIENFLKAKGYTRLKKLAGDEVYTKNKK